MSKPKINDIAAIDRCILRSKYIIMAQSVQQTRKEEDYFFNHFPTNTLVSKIHLPELDKEIFVLIDGWKRDIANFLRPIFHAQNIEMDDKFWFSSFNLKEGYVLLSTRQMAPYGVDDRVLLLSTVDIGSEKLFAGQIITWEKHTKIIDKIPSVIDKTFITHYSFRKAQKYDKDRNKDR